MADIDFIIGFLVIFSVISFLIFYSNNYASNQISFVQGSELEQEANILSNYLLEKGSDISLVSELKRAPLKFIEEGGYSHTEDVKLQIDFSSLEYIVIYDRLLNEIPTSIQISDNKATINFPLQLNPNQNITLYMLYFGGEIDNVVDSTNKTRNISDIIVTEQVLDIIRLDRCTELQSKGYDQVKQELGITRDFNLTYSGCSFGKPVNVYDVYSIEKSVLVEQKNNVITTDKIKLLVW